MDADKDNPASWKTMESLGDVNIKEFFDDENAHCIVKDYEIDVNESINNYSTIYEPMIGQHLQENKQIKSEENLVLFRYNIR